MKKNFIKALAALALVPAMLFTGCSAENETADNAAAGEDNSLQAVLDSGKLILGLDATFKPMGFTDENDNIVFYIQAGEIAGEIAGTLFYPFSMAEIIASFAE